MKRRVKNTKKRSKKRSKKRYSNDRYTKKRYSKNRYTKNRYTKKRYNKKKLSGGSFLLNYLFPPEPGDIEIFETSRTLSELCEVEFFLNTLASEFSQTNLTITDLNKDINLKMEFRVTQLEGQKQYISIGLKPRLHDGPALQKIDTGSLNILLYNSEHAVGSHDFELLIGNTKKDTDTPNLEKKVKFRFSYEQLDERYSSIQDRHVVHSRNSAVVEPEPGPEPEPEPMPEPVINPVISSSDQANTDIWIKRRNGAEKKAIELGSPLALNRIYFDPQTNINIVYDILSREAKTGMQGQLGNIYLHIDNAHGMLIGKETILNKNLHLLLTPARGTTDEGRGVIRMTLRIMKLFLHAHGGEDLFNLEGCMTLKGSFLFYSLACLWYGITPGRPLWENYGTLKTKYNEEIGLPFSEFYRIINSDLGWVGQTAAASGSRSIRNMIKRMIKRMMFRILKLYNPGDTVNDTSFSVLREEEERMNGMSRKTGFSGKKDTKFGVNILYTNNDDENKYIHLPLNEIPRDSFGKIFLSQIIDYLKPLERLPFNFFMKHGSCRVDDEYFDARREQDPIMVSAREYKPDLTSLTRKISTPKEEANKNCFINYFRESHRIATINAFLKKYYTLVDYHVWLESVGKLDDYIDILINHGEGSPELYKFISENH